MYQLVLIFGDWPTVYERHATREAAMIALRLWIPARNLIGYEVVDSAGEVVYEGPA